jgi:hypothetical protein
VLAALAATALVPSCFSDPASDVLGGAIEPTLSSIQEHVFTPTCAVSQCHAPPAQLDLDLRAGHARASLVGVPSQEVPERFRVTAGNAAESYLYMKLAGDPRILGERMPFGGAPLPAEQLEAIRLWIENGAAND